MASPSIVVERAPDMERLAGLEIEACGAYLAGGEVAVVGEVVTTTKRADGNYKELHAVVYGGSGAVLGHNYQNWGAFGLRRSISIHVRMLGSEVPTCVRVYPTEG
jgi:hypothetical protein